MKKHIPILLCMLVTSGLFAQNPSYQDKLFYTCKVWGYAKYYHSRVSTCQVNWDSVLVKFLPGIKATVTNDDFNNMLDSILTAAGPMAIASTPAPVVSPELSRNIHLEWFNDATINNNVRTKLNEIKDNFRPHANCWVQNNGGTGNSGWLVFAGDSLMLDKNTYSTYPNEEERLLVTFKYWNLINYFNPYNYTLDKPWDSTLYQYGIEIANAATAPAFESLFEKITARLDDAHVEGLTYNANSLYNKVYAPNLLLKYIESKYIVVKSNISTVKNGDEIVAIDGLSTIQWEDSLRPYISSGNPNTFRRFMCTELLAGAYNSNVVIDLKNASGIIYTINANRGSNKYGTWFSSYYPNDSLSYRKWETINCNIGYVHMGNMEIADVTDMYDNLKTKDAIIFDIRNYPQGTAFSLAPLMYPNRAAFSRITQPDVNYPGTYTLFDYELGNNNNSDAYGGKVILLMNEQTQSHAEFSCMIFEAMPNVVKIGSQTAGADGNITYFNVTDDIQTGFTALGIYYPNDDSTQRIGIVPDIVAYPTQEGIRQGRDEVLEKALQVVGCFPAAINGIPTSVNASIYPNPANDAITLQLSNAQTEYKWSIIDITNRELMQNTATGNYANIDIKSLSPGTYFLTITTAYEKQAIKFIKR